MKRSLIRSFGLAGRVARTSVAVLAGIAIGAGGYALASSSGGKQIHGCVNPRTHVLTVWPKCRHGNRKLVFNQQGERGPAGVAPWRIDYGIVFGAPVEGDVPASCAANPSKGLAGPSGTDCTYLGVGEYELTASGCSKDQNEATAPPVDIQVTPQSFVNDSTYVLHAQLYGGDEHIVNNDGTLTFTIQLFGGEDTSNASLQPVDGAADVVVFC
jgi:hypothetical protein